MPIKQKKLSFSPKISKNSAYFPLTIFSKDLGFSLYWSSSTKTLDFLAQIHGLTIKENKNKLTILLKSNSLLDVSQSYILDSPTRYFWDIHNSRILFKSRHIPIDHPHIKRISIGQHPKKTRLVITPLTHLTLSESTLASGGHSFKLHRAEKQGPHISQSKKPHYKRLSTPRSTQKHTSRYKTSTKQLFRPGLKNKVIALEAGHGGMDPGSIGPGNALEKNYTKDITDRLKKYLESNGAKVIMTRKGDSNPSQQTRVYIANKRKADIFVSIHINSFIKPYAYGTETLYYKSKDRALSNAIHKNLVSSIKRYDKGQKRAGMYVLKYTTMPAVLVEPCFISNPTESHLLKTPQFRDKIAKGVFNGIEAYFNNN